MNTAGLDFAEMRQQRSEQLIGAADQTARRNEQLAIAQLVSNELVSSELVSSELEGGALTAVASENMPELYTLSFGARGSSRDERSDAKMSFESSGSSKPPQWPGCAGAVPMRSATHRRSRFQIVSSTN